MRDYYSNTAQIPGTLATGETVAEPLSNVRVSVYKLDAAGARLAAMPTLYTTRTGATIQSNPFTTDVSGAIEFWADPGQYEIELVDLTVPERFADRKGVTSIGWSSIPGAPAGIDKTQLPEQGAGMMPTGALAPFAGTVAPAGWAMCSGQALDRTVYNTLFALIGTTYGAGDGTTTFNVPDMRGRVPVGVEGGSGRLTANKTLGSAAGEERTTLTKEQLASHAHMINGTVALDGQNNPYIYDDPTAGGLPAAVAIVKARDSTDWVRLDFRVPWQGGGGDYFLPASDHDPSGLTETRNQSHNTMQPFLVLNYIIKL